MIEPNRNKVERRSGRERNGGSGTRWRVARFAAGSMLLTGTTAARVMGASIRAGTVVAGSLAEAASGLIPSPEASPRPRSGNDGSKQPRNGRQESVAVASAVKALKTIDQMVVAGGSMARLGFGDTNGLRRAIGRAIRLMGVLGASGEVFGEALPAPLVTPRIRLRARRIAGSAPVTFLAALDEEVSDPRERLRTVLGALMTDRRRLGVLAVNYPQVMALGAVNAGRLIASGQVALEEVAAYWQGLNLEAAPREPRPPA